MLTNAEKFGLTYTPTKPPPSVAVYLSPGERRKLGLPSTDGASAGAGGADDSRSNGSGAVDAMDPAAAAATATFAAAESDKPPPPSPPSKKGWLAQKLLLAAFLRVHGSWDDEPDPPAPAAETAKGKEGAERPNAAGGEEKQQQQQQLQHETRADERRKQQEEQREHGQQRKEKPAGDAEAERKADDHGQYEPMRTVHYTFTSISPMAVLRLLSCTSLTACVYVSMHASVHAPLRQLYASTSIMDLAP